MTEKTLHYYGDLVRKFFLAGAVLMLVFLPFMTAFIDVPIYISILSAVFIGIVAGITNPKQLWSIILNFFVSLSAAVIFEYQAVVGYNTYSITHRMFWANQILAVIFLISLYYCTKTIRGMLVK